VTEVEGDYDAFVDGNAAIISTPGHTSATSR
jgi:hypothetical protein